MSFIMKTTQLNHQTSAATRNQKTADQRPEAASKPAAAEVGSAGILPA